MPPLPYGRTTRAGRNVTTFTFHLEDGFADRSDTVPGDDIKTLDDAREAVAQLGGEAMRKLSRSSSWSGTWTIEAKDTDGKTDFQLSIFAR